MITLRRFQQPTTIAAVAVAVAVVVLGPRVANADTSPWLPLATGEPVTEGVLVSAYDLQLLVAYGGRTKNINKTSDASDTLLVLDVSREEGEWVNLTRRARGLRPGKIFAAAAIYWPGRQHMVLYGGKGNRGLVALDMSRGLDDLLWLRPRVPGKAETRVSHTAVYAPDQDRMIVYGGTRGDTNVVGATYADALVIAPAGQGYRITTLRPGGVAPPARYDHSAVYDPVSGAMLVYGGQLSKRGPVYSDLWALDLREPHRAVWRPVAPPEDEAAPGPRAAHRAVYDPLRHHMVIYGGKGRTAKEVWALELAGGLDGVRWTQLLSGPELGAPLTPSHHGAVWVDDQDCMVVYGGSIKGGESAATWMYHPADSAGHRWQPDRAPVEQ